MSSTKLKVGDWVEIVDAPSGRLNGQYGKIERIDDVDLYKFPYYVRIVDELLQLDNDEIKWVDPKDVMIWRLSNDIAK